MKSRVDESDADSPQDATPGSGAPAARPLTPLDELFAHVEDGGSQARSAEAEAASRERLAAFFTGGKAAPAAEEPQVEVAFEEDAAAVPAGELVTTPAPENAAATPAEDDTAFDEVGSAFMALGFDEIAVDEVAVDEVAVDESAAADIAPDDLAADQGADEDAVDERATDGPDVENTTIAATAVATAAAPTVAFDAPNAGFGAPTLESPAGDTGVERGAIAASAADESPADSRSIGWLWESPAAAEPQPYPHNGTFAPARRGLRGTLFGSRSRAAVSVAASIVLVAALVVGAAFVAQNLAASARLAEARNALESAEGAIGAPAESLDAAFTQYDETLLAAHAAADSATPAFAAVAGMADPAALDAANVALAALVAALDQPAPAPQPEPYERGDVEPSDIDGLTAAADDARDYAEDVDAAKIEVDAAQDELTLRLAALTDARVALGASLPATAAAIAGENPKADQSFRDAVIAAAAAVGSAQAAGGSGDAELLAYAAAVTALRADQARALAEEQSRSVTKPRTTNPGTTNPGTTTPTPSPSPTTSPPPAPDPEPTPEPSPTP